jgi:hypothetical protein
VVRYSFGIAVAALFKVFSLPTPRDLRLPYIIAIGDSTVATDGGWSPGFLPLAARAVPKSPTSPRVAPRPV